MSIEKPAEVSKEQLRKDNAALVAFITGITERLNEYPVLDSILEIQVWHSDAEAVLEAHGHESE